MCPNVKKTFRTLVPFPVISSKASKRKTDQFYSDSKSEPNNLCIPRADIDYGSYRRVAGKRSMPDPVKRSIEVPAWALIPRPEGWAAKRKVAVPWMRLKKEKPPISDKFQEGPWTRLKKEQLIYPNMFQEGPWTKIKKEQPINPNMLQEGPWTQLKREQTINPNMLQEGPWTRLKREQTINPNMLQEGPWTRLKREQTINPNLLQEGPWTRLKREQTINPSMLQEGPWTRLKKEQPTNPESTPWIRLKKSNVQQYERVLRSHNPWTRLKRKPPQEEGEARSYLSRMGRSIFLGGPGRSSYLIRMGRSTGGLEDSKLELPEPEPLA